MKPIKQTPLSKVHNTVTPQGRLEQSVTDLEINDIEKDMAITDLEIDGIEKDTPITDLEIAVIELQEINNVN